MAIGINRRTFRTLTLVAALPLFLAGCLFTEEPLLDGTNSTPGAESPEVQAFIEAKRSYAWPDAGPNDLPVPLFTRGAEGPDLSILRATPLTDDMALIQEHLDECLENYCYVYYAVRVRDDGVPEICLVDTKATDLLLADATAHGVTLVVITNDHKDHRPPDIGMHGAKPDLMAFVVAQFEQGRIECEAPDGNADD